MDTKVKIEVSISLIVLSLTSLVVFVPTVYMCTIHTRTCE